MKCPKNTVRLFALIASLMILLVVIGCGDDGGGPSGPKLPTDPGPGNLAGLIVGTINGRTLAGVTVSVGQISTTTDSDGIFRLDGVGEGILAVMIEGGDIYTRRAAVDTATGRSVLLDAIEVNSSFNLGFYRELIRMNHPEEGPMHPTRRWVNPTPPTVYIVTDTVGVLDGNIDQSTINAVRNVFSKMVPIWTGNFYSSLPIEVRATFDFNNIPDNSIVLAFDDTLYLYEGALGLTVYEALPSYTIDRVVIILLDAELFYSLSGVTLEQVASHELGHGFGFEHTSLLSSIMPKYPHLPSGVIYTEADKLHAAVMYRRPAANTDIDNDPVPGAKIVGEAPGTKIYIDRAPNPPKLSLELTEQLQSLRGHDIVKKHLNR